MGQRWQFQDHPLIYLLNKINGFSYFLLETVTTFDPDRSLDGDRFDQTFTAEVPRAPKSGADQAEDRHKGIEQRFQDVEERMTNLEITTKALINIMGKFDQSLNNNVMMIKKRAMSMKAFYEKIKEVRRKLSTNEDFDKKFGKWAASGPACAVECLFFVDVKAV